MRFAKILCPVDFSEASHEAMRVAAGLASSFDSSLTLVHIFQLPLLAVPEMSLSPLLLDEIMKRTDEGLSRWAREASELGARRVETTRLEGAPWDVIVKLAGSGGADVIVMGTHGRTGLRHAWLGSVAEKVVRHAPCPVLVTRPTAPAASP